MPGGVRWVLPEIGQAGGPLALGQVAEDVDVSGHEITSTGRMAMLC
jgi:hypothetical protein